VVFDLIMSRFTTMDCIPCRIGAPTLSKQEINSYLHEVTGWIYKTNPDKITKQFEFKDFRSALKFVNKVGIIAEKQNHHPDILLHSYKKVRIELWTHKINGLHQNDFILAAKIDSVKS